MDIKFDRQKIMERLSRNVLNTVKAGAIELQTAIREKLNQHNSSLTSGNAASLPGSPPGNQTGKLANSIQAVDVTKDALHPHWRVGTDLPYSAIQEYGGRIRAAKGKFLAVPVGPDGRRAAREANGDIRRLNLRLIRTKAGKLLLVKTLYKREKAAKGSKGVTSDQTVILFVLKKEVYLPPRPYFRPVAAEKLPGVQAKVNKAVASALEGP